jgi:hypothetical protein
MASRFWVGGSGTWDNSSTTHWSATSGGAAGASAPTNADTATFDSNSGTAATVTVASTAVSLNTTVNKSDITLSLSGSPTLCTSAGVLTLTAGIISLGSNTLSIGRFSSQNTNARTLDFGTGKVILTGSGTTIWATVTNTNLVISGTPVVDCTYSGSTGTRTINGPAASATSEANSIDFNITAGSDSVTLANALFKSLNFTGFSGTFTSSATIIYGDLTIPATVTSVGGNQIRFSKSSGTQTVLTNGITIGATSILVNGGGTVVFNDALTATGTAFTWTLGTIKFKAGVTSTLPTLTTTGTTQKYLQSTAAGSQATLSIASGTISVSYTTIQDINATGGATWNAFLTSNNVNAGNNTGWDWYYEPGEYMYTRRKTKRLLIQ